jgi:hypothetical protein
MIGASVFVMVGVITAQGPPLTAAASVTLQLAVLVKFGHVKHEQNCFYQSLHECGSHQNYIFDMQVNYH